MLQKETAQTLGNWIFQNIICHWETLLEIVSDNGKPSVAALNYLEKKYDIKHIQISSYNLCANSIVKRSHFNIQQALFKASDGVKHKWLQVAYLVFWSKHITSRKHMGYSSYFAMIGMYPLILFNIIKANYLALPLDSLLSTMDLIAQRAIVLQKQQKDLVQLKD